MIYIDFHRWTDVKLKKVINMLRDPKFNSKELDPDLHKRMQQAVEDGRIKCFDLREGSADGEQDLKAWMRELKDVVTNLLGRLWKILCSRATRTSVSKWTWTLLDSDYSAVRPMLEWPSRLDN